MRNSLTRELENEFRHREFLFKQRKGVGQVAVIGPTLTDRPGQYVLFMITRVNHYAKLELDNVINCVYELKEICLSRKVKLLSFPILDPGRGRMRLLNFYMLLACVFADTDIMILLHDRYFISIGEESPGKTPKIEGPTDAKKQCEQVKCHY